MPNQPFRSTSTLRFALVALVLVASALEGRYGQPELYGDDIAYLDVVNLIRLGDWKTALNPLWSIGYPLLLSVARFVFPSDIHGELRAVFWLNMAISLAAYLAFLWLVREILIYHRHRSEPASQIELKDLSPLTLVAATFAYLTAAIGCARISSIGPDLLVAGLFFAASALLLRFIQHPSNVRAATIGVVLGIGYIAKAFFLPLAAIFLAMLFFTCIRQRRYVSIATAAICWLIFVVVYGAGLSWAFGHPTLGESAALNYAYHVNKLPHWMGWQGDPLHGTPIHPVHLLRTEPAVFAFGEPFHVTYPPQYDMPYWYEGFRHYTRIGNALRAIPVNLHSTAGVIVRNAGFVLAVLVAAFFALRLRPNRRPWLRQLASTWPWTVPSLLGVILYEQVHLESRYIAGFVAVLCVVPFLAVDLFVAKEIPPDSTTSQPLTPRLRTLLLVLVVAGGSADLLFQLKDPLVLAAHRAPVQTEGQWRISQFLVAAGLHPGDKVADVSDGNNIRCAWAYGARVHIVAAIGNDAYDMGGDTTSRDLHLFFEDPAIQRDTLALFRQQGAVAVVAPRLPFTTTDPGWQHIPDTDAWLLLLK